MPSLLDSAPGVSCLGPSSLPSHHTLGQPRPALDSPHPQFARMGLGLNKLMKAPIAPRRDIPHSGRPGDWGLKLSGLGRLESHF